MPLDRDEIEGNRPIDGILSFECRNRMCNFRVEGPVWAVIPVIRDHEAVHIEGWV